MKILIPILFLSGCCTTVYPPPHGDVFCRIGMTSKPVKNRIIAWDSHYRQWADRVSYRTIGRFKTKVEAQDFETKMANEIGCISGIGGGGPDVGDWRVYKIDLKIKKKFVLNNEGGL